MSDFPRRERELIDLLLKEKLINEDMLNQAREETQKTGLSVMRALEKLGFVVDDNLLKIQAEALGVPYMDVADYQIDKQLIKALPKDGAQKFKAVPLFKIGQNLTVGMLDPQDVLALDEIRKISGMETVEPVLISERGFQRVIDVFYGAQDSLQALISAIERDQKIQKQGRSLTEIAEEAPVIKLVNAIFLEAMRLRASDIHIEPEEDYVRIRLRIDGVLRELIQMPKSIQSLVTSRVKILSTMDIAESRRPQDGRIQLELEDKQLDVRVSTFPTIHGENVVMRLLEKSSVLFGLKDIGFGEKELKAFEQVIQRPYGIIFITGPTGSGKTTTLYSALTTISSMEKNIVTIEDPVEYELPLIRQTQVNPKANVTFSNGLRSILRQDPDVIMVGEIRDKETAEIAIQAALTGHLVFSTLHTNDATSALTRLIDMGVEPFLIATSTIGILAQRLVREICPKCKEEFKPPKELLKDLGLRVSAKSKDSFYKGKGCPACHQTGYLGRSGIFELLLIDEDIRRMTEERKSTDDIKKKALSQEMITLKENGLKKARQGITTIEEVLRVTEVV